ncbi:hypothetical protein J3R82DRAFT_785 [Butyriboletus roseoflavus]|nr:hypothetical protein J3R82DRAFT_785 [Butyriboletus roseoflavus]
MALPQHMRADDPAAADPARRRLLQKPSVLRFPSLPSRPSKPLSLPLSPTDHPADDILIDDAHLPHSLHDKDVFRWAILYENQRGITLFSTPFYSPLSLLPSDPQPFTLPHTYNTRAPHSNFSLDNFPLPDGTWRWVSTAWMIDMRTDLGEVQHDGFEYNWHFRDKHWHSQIGTLGAGAWVRRRRWIRLMMRPANHTHGHNPPCNGIRTTILVCPASNPSLLELDHHEPHLWDGGEQDWQHVHRLLKQLGRDGRKLELWRVWLGPWAQTHASNFKAKAKLSDAPSLSSQEALEKRLSNVFPEGNRPPLVHLITILRNHGEAILHSFVFPDSRAQFVDLVRQAGLAHDLEICLGRAFSVVDVDFWSYADSLDKR